MLLLEIFLYLVLGTFSGVLAGLFGIGGGIVIIPTFFYVFSFLGFPSEILSHMVLGSSLELLFLAPFLLLFHIVTGGLLTGSCLRRLPQASV